jgi:excinuclease ABC subunit C
MLLQRKKQRISHANKQRPAERILRTLQQDLQMDELPMHIECFDNSNIQGTNPTAVAWSLRTPTQQEGLPPL